jgi:SAM-dependent methyltransferase
MSQPDLLHTDRRHLTTAAYANSANLMADIYRYQQPRLDIVGWALDQVRWEGVKRVVDVGCGPGQYLRRLAQRAGLDLIGLDLSRGMLADLERGWGFGRVSAENSSR